MNSFSKLPWAISFIVWFGIVHPNSSKASDHRAMAEPCLTDGHAISVSTSNSPIKEEFGRFLIVLPPGFPIQASTLKSASFKIVSGKSEDSPLAVPISLQKDQDIPLTQVHGGLEARVKLSQLPPGTFEISFKIKHSKSAWESVKDKIRGREEPARCKHGLNLGELHAETRFQIDPSLEVADPGEAGLQTLEGIDSDKDGVRDDVQRWINEQGFGDRIRSAAKQLARAKQKMLANQSDLNQSISSSHSYLDAVDCIEYVMGLDSADRVIFKIKSKQLNSDARIRANIKIEGYFHGEKSTFTSLEDDKKKCSFDVDKLAN